MNFQSKGLFISIIILIALLLICHISNFLYPKNSKYNKNINSFSNLALSIPNTPVDTQYNQLIYNKEIDPLVCKNVNEAEIPCDVISSCSVKKSVPTTTPYQLSDSEWAVVYRDAYQSAGREVLMRALSEKNEDTVTTIPNK